MSERWVVNASPLIALSKVGHADWLAALSDELVVPQAVAAEIQAGPPNPARQFLAAGRLPLLPAPPAVPEVADWGLGSGETAVLSWAATQPGWTAIIDDLPARRCARALSLPHKGTLAVVIRAG